METGTAGCRGKPRRLEAPSRPCVLDSFAGMAAFQKVTKAYKENLTRVTSRESVRADGSLTVSVTARAGIRCESSVVGSSDPILLDGEGIAQRIKGTLGITG